MTKTFLVTAATGKVGTELVHLLAASGHRVRAVTRNPDGAKARLLQAFAPALVEPTTLDVDDDASLAQAFDGTDGAMLIFPFAGDIVAWHQRMAKAARAAGTDFLVKLSVTGARAPDSDPVPGRLPLGHFRGEEACRASGVPTVCIRPTIFAQHFLMNTGMFTPGDDRVFLPTGEARVAFVDCRDIAHCAHALFDGDDALRTTWAGKSFELTGPQGHTAAELVTMLGHVRGTPLRHLDGVEAFSARCEELGKSDGIKGIYGEAAGGWFAEVQQQEFAAITGRSTTSFAKFAFDHAAFFRAGG